MLEISYYSGRFLPFSKIGCYFGIKYSVGACSITHVHTRTHAHTLFSEILFQSLKMEELMLDESSSVCFMSATMRRMPSAADSNRGCVIAPRDPALPITVPQRRRYRRFPVEASRFGT